MERTDGFQRKKRSVGVLNQKTPLGLDLEGLQ